MVTQRKPVPIVPRRDPSSAGYAHPPQVDEDDQPYDSYGQSHNHNNGQDYYYTQGADVPDDQQDPYPYYPSNESQEQLEPTYAARGAEVHGRQLSQAFFDEAAAALNNDTGYQGTAPLNYTRRPPSAADYQYQAPTYDAPMPADYAAVHSDPYGSQQPDDYATYPHQPQDDYDDVYQGSPESHYDDKTEMQHTPAAFRGQTPLVSQTIQEPYHTTDRGDVGYAAPQDEYPDEKEGYYTDEGDYSGEHDDWNGDEEGNFANTVPLDTQHFGPAPAKGALLRRHKTKKKVALTQGNLVLDCPVPSKLKGFLTRRGDEEFETMRYTAVTCDPEEFPTSHYTLRPCLADRHTELFIAITLYNEDEVLLTRTLHGVFKNIAHLCSRSKSRTWGTDGWKKVVVAIIADGRKKVHPRVYDCLAALGVYQEGVAKNVVNGKRVEAHLYEYTTQLSIDSNLQFKGAERGLVPVQVLFCVKERNQKKINSHKWFFSAFGPLLQPNVCILLDAGTRPEAKSIYYLWKSFDLHSNVGGACGEIVADVKGKWGFGKALINPLVAAQNFEYKLSNILDKPTESMFGYISVLPGAFSAYRYLALQNDDLGRGPLASYFKGEALLGADADVFSSNMYLAEDRILCFELAAKRGESWVLKYIRQARGVTDVPDSLDEFISQRRRWLNGSLFAAVYALSHTRQFLSSDHGLTRKIFLMIEAFYSLVNVCFSWFGVANYYIFFRILTQSLESSTFNIKGISVVNTIVQYIYLATLVACFIFSLGNRPQGGKWKYMTASIIFAVLTLYMMIAAVFCFVHAIGNLDNAVYAQMVVSLLSTYGVYLISSCIALDPFHLLTSFLQFLLLTPTFINILQVYAMANIHDFSWGTKGSDTVSNDLGTVTSTGQGNNNVVELSLPTGQVDIDGAYDEALNKLRTRPMIIKGESGAAEKELARKDYYASIRSNVLLVWVITNGLLAAIILGGDTSTTFVDSAGSTRSSVYMVIVLVFVAAMSCIRFIGSTIYMAIRLVAG